MILLLLLLEGSAQFQHYGELLHGNMRRAEACLCVTLVGSADDGMHSLVIGFSDVLLEMNEQELDEAPPPFT